MATSGLARISTRRRAQAIPLGLALAAFAVALAQRPGELVADTKIDLHVDPARFLSDVTAAWSHSGGLGQLQAGQYAGYLFPMAPFHAVAHALGVAPWLTQRLWLGTVLALAAWGTVRLLDALLDRPRGVAHLTAGALVLLNPYVLVFAGRTSITLLAYAALPWLLLATYRGLRNPKGWWWPAAFALVLASAGGGVNAAVVGWILLGPALLVAYEMGYGGLRRRDALAFLGRVAPLSVLASLWWLMPVAVHARYGLNLLPFTESVGSIWSSTSMSEDLRGLGYWTVYVGIGYGDRLQPFTEAARTLLYSPGVVAASLLVPALALSGFVWTRRWRYGPFFLAMVLLGLLVMAAGFPDGTLFRRLLVGVYYHAEPVQFLRTTYKAGPLVVLALACLGGAGAAAVWEQLRGRPRARAAAAVVAAVLVAGSAWPLVTGRAYDANLAFDAVPGYWRAAGHDLDRTLPANSRALVLPGQLFAYYRWGFPQDPILPALTRRPVAVRNVVPYANLHAVDALVTADSLVQQRRLVPGQLRQLLGLLGARAVVTGANDDIRLSGAIAPAPAAQQLRIGAGLDRPDRRYGPTRRYPPATADLGGGARLPAVRRYDLRGGPGVVRVHPRAAPLVVDGSADGLAGLSALGALPGDRTALYAADMSRSELRRAAAGGAEVVVTDSNRRRVFVSSRPVGQFGPVMPADAALSRDAASLDPFARGSSAQTVATYAGARDVQAPYSPEFVQFPEHRAYAAFDGDPGTYWVADRNLERDRHWVEIRFNHPRQVPYVDILPARESATDVRQVEIAGRRFPIRPGWNRLPTRLRRASQLRALITSRRKVTSRLTGGPGALAEVRLPGVRVRELLRPPVLATRALVGLDTRRVGLSFLFERVRGDDPYRRARRQDPNRGAVPRLRSQEAALASQPGDAEQAIARAVELPAARDFRADGWASVVPSAPDPALDRLAGYRGPARFSSSGRYQGVAGRRASSAFDGDPGTAWVGEAGSGARPWVAWRPAAPLALRRLRLRASPGLPAPLRVRLVWEGGHTGALRVGPGGEVRFRRPVSARSFRLEILATRPARGAPRGAVGIAEVDVPGLARARLPRAGPLPSRCGAVRVRIGSAIARTRLAGDVRSLDGGLPLRLRPCGGPARARAGRASVSSAGEVVRADILRLRSPAPLPVRTPQVGRVLRVGSEEQGRYDGVRLEVNGPSWLVLGESFNEGWRAWCDGRSLGAPRVVDGFANGWRVDSRCRTARFAFGPQKSIDAARIVSGLAVLLMLGFMVLRWRRRRPGDPATPAPVAAVPEGVRRLPLPRAAAIGLAAGVVFSFLFAIRAGVFLGPLVALVLWRGMGARLLTAAAGVLLAVALPVVYLLLMPPRGSGVEPRYPIDLIAGHWISVAAWTLLALALWRSVSKASRPGEAA